VHRPVVLLALVFAFAFVIQPYRPAPLNRGLRWIEYDDPLVVLLEAGFISVGSDYPEPVIRLQLSLPQQSQFEHLTVLRRDYVQRQPETASYGRKMCGERAGRILPGQLQQRDTLAGKVELGTELALDRILPSR